MSARFFPDPEPEPAALKTSPSSPLHMDLTCNEGDVKFLLQHTAPWKAPGLDGIPIGFFKALGKPFNIAMAKIINTLLIINHFPIIYKKN